MDYVRNVFVTTIISTVSGTGSLRTQSRTEVNEQCFGSGFIRHKKQKKKLFEATRRAKRVLRCFLLDGPSSTSIWSTGRDFTSSTPLLTYHRQPSRWQRSRANSDASILSTFLGHNSTRVIAQVSNVVCTQHWKYHCFIAA